MHLMSYYRVQFIQDARQFAPVSARFVEWSYGADSYLKYRGRLESSSRGQQRCPLMMALFCLTRKCIAEAARIAAGVHPEFEVAMAQQATSFSFICLGAHAAWTIE